MTRQVCISEDKFIPGLTDLTQTIHSHGAKIAIQLQHGGRIAAPFLSGGQEPVAPSAVPLVPAELGTARELTVTEVARLVQCFALAAGRAQKAGFDGVEIHAGHGYLIDQFLSRHTNRRQDDYGGDLKNRARFLLEIIKAARASVGNSYPLWCRIDGREFAIENGITPEEAREIAGLIEQAGADAVHVSGYGGSEGLHFTDAPLVNIPGYLVPLARDIKSRVKITVIAVGRISPEMGEEILRRGEADLIAMGRPLLADPELPHKLAAGTPEEIRKCIYCYTCVHQIFVRNNVCCSINPAVGKESEPVPGPLPKSKRVLVVGGGPAGLTAAVTAAGRGHQVTLWEKENRLGGSLLFASIVRPENADLVRYLIERVKKSNIQVKSGLTFKPEQVESLKPDVVIWAAGAIRRNPPLPGIEGPQVINGDDLRQMLAGKLSQNSSKKLTAVQKAILYSGRALLSPFLTPEVIRKLARVWMPVGRRVTVLGGGLVGCELASFLSERGRRVTIVESGDQLAPEMALPMKWLVMEQLSRHNVAVFTGVKYDKITTQGLVIINKEGVEQILAADSIIVATGTEPNREIPAALQGKAPEIYLAGDCGKLSFIKDAIADGYRVGSMI